MNQLERVRRRHVWLMKTTVEILGHLVRPLPEEAWRSWRDGQDGWSILEVVVHLRDFDKIFQTRAKLMIAQDNPQLGAYDHEAMAIQGGYNDLPVEEVWHDLHAHRHEFVQFFKGLSEEDWEREGDHPERDVFTMLDAVMQVGLHDTNHIEQIARIIFEHAGPSE